MFNWLYARHTKGRLVLRIEDTDVKRSTQASADAIFEALEWLGIDWDDGPYFQSKRFDIYGDYVNRLLGSENAYYCTCTPERLEDMRQRAMAVGGKPKYDGTCREKGLSEADGAVVRLKAPLTGTTIVADVVKGNIVFQNSELDDFIIRRSDGTPTYNFCVVVDDITMGINTVIRGDDHVMNTPKQMLIYHALDHELPIYAHVPMVLGPDRTRLSKRHGAMSVTAYRDMGFLPAAVVNYLVRLGWSFGDQEFFTRDELIEKFTLENIGTSAGIFDMDKLLSLNAEHMKVMPLADLSRLALPFFQDTGYGGIVDPIFEKAVATLIPRSKTLEEMADTDRFYFTDAIAYDEKAARKFLKPAALEPLERLTDELNQLDAFDEPSLESAFTMVMEETGLKLGKIAQPVRVALTGKTASPGIFEVISIIGKDKVIARLKDAIAYIHALPA